MADLVYKKAGHIKLTRRSDSKVFMATGLVQSIQPLNLNRGSTAIPDGNNAFDKTFSNGATGGVVVNLTSWNPTFWGAIATATVTTGQTVNMPQYQEITVPATGPYTVVLAATPVAGSISIVDELNTNFVAGVPTATGEYLLATATLTFVAADAGKKLYVYYTKASVTASKVEITGEENIAEFELVVIGEGVLTGNEGTAKADAITFDTVKVLGDINHPTRQKEPGAAYAVTFTLQSPRAGNKAISYLVSE